MKKSIDVDVAIVGTGLVGLALACLLAEADLKIAIIEAREIKHIELNQDSYQLRVSAINAASEKLFKQLGVWEKIVSTQRVSSYEKMTVWDSLGRGRIHFDCTEIGAGRLGCILENSVIQNALLEKLKQYNQVVICEKTEPTGFSMHSKAIGLKLGKNEITAKLIVGADGAESWVRKQTGISCYEWPYHHESLVTTVKLEYPHQKTAWQCFLAEGPVALLPLFDSHVGSIVWSSSPDEIRRIANLNSDAFNFELTHVFERRFGNIQKIDYHKTFPLVMRHAKNYVKPRIALIGDAAHTIHPLAGLGVNLGLADAWMLAREIIHAHQTGQDCGDYLGLRRYERNRKGQNWLMTLGVECFKRLFESKTQSMISLRNLGLSWINTQRLIKNQFVYQAMDI